VVAEEEEAQAHAAVEAGEYIPYVLCHAVAGVVVYSVRSLGSPPIC
jgi:hypothetical protein